MADPVDGTHQMINGVVGHRQGAMTAGIGSLKHKILRGFFRRQDSERDAVSLCIQIAPTAFIYCKFSINGSVAFICVAVACNT